MNKAIIFLFAVVLMVSSGFALGPMPMPQPQPNQPNQPQTICVVARAAQVQAAGYSSSDNAGMVLGMLGVLGVSNPSFDAAGNIQGYVGNYTDKCKK